MIFGAEHSANGVIFMAFLSVAFLHFESTFNENFSASVAFECKNYTLLLRPEATQRLGLNKKSASLHFICVFFIFFGGDDTS